MVNASMRARRRQYFLAAAILGFAAIALVAVGCNEPVMYQVRAPDNYLTGGKKILVMPFMDSRTFVNNHDPHKYDLGVHARDIFAEALRAKAAGDGSEILTPALTAPRKSLTNAEVAEIGRQNGADVVVSGQIFSFTETRAASIPPRAGMFVRVISASDASLLFVGDHYLSAAMPGAAGGREQQARLVAERLVEGFLAKARVTTAGAAIASTTALASIASMPRRALATNQSRDGAKRADASPDPAPGLTGGAHIASPGWDDGIIPEAPPLLDFDEEFYELPSLADAADGAVVTVAAKESPTTSAKDAGSEKTDAETGVEPAAASVDQPIVAPRKDVTPDAETVETDVSPKAVDASERADAANKETSPPLRTEAGEADGPVGCLQSKGDGEEAKREPAAFRVSASEIDELPELSLSDVDTALDEGERARLADAVTLSGDELAVDLFENDGDIWSKEESLLAASPSRPDLEKADAVDAGSMTATPSATESAVAATMPAVAASPDRGPFEFDPDTLEIIEPTPKTGVNAAAAGAAPASRDAVSRKARNPSVAAKKAVLSANDNGPIVSTPLAVEQPRTYKSADLVELAADPSASLPNPDARVARGSGNAAPGAIRVLILPYHDRDNPNNLIAHTGGGEVVTTLYGTQLALDPGIQLMWDASGQATHDRLLSRDEAIQMGKMAGVDFVMRGQVVEFRRAQSVPSFFSAVISTAVLAAQVFFAEMSGVDVATEVYRVSDGLCVMSRRDRAQQKYIVQAEKTVRRMALGMSEGVSGAVRDTNPEPMDPLIDDLSPVTVLTNPR